MADAQKVELPPAPTSAPSPTTQSEAAAVNSESSNAESSERQRPNILTGNLPDGFLRLESGVSVQSVPIPQAVYASGGAQFYPTYYQKGGILSVTLSQARLAKNYGLSRMDPYCRVKVGSVVLETKTSHNGSKTPRWNQTFNIPLPDGENRMFIEMFDECAFSPDERIAWGHILIKDEVIAGETVDDWYSLTGKQGTDKEGMINIILQYRESPIPAQAPAPMYVQPMPVMMSYGTQMAYTYPPGVAQPLPGAQQQFVRPQQPQQPQQQPQQQTISDEDVKKVKDMFPNMEEEIIRSVLLSSNGDVDTAVNHLLSMTAS
ncbi:toll-interacting protein B-like [Rhopilema esculentum]|uniref:toll-interacting protein B-like n=1 Tax=Rhopilema esculentum TaxID=499914 RepID=UPI0031D9889E|eukprot:gene5322-491_t